MGAKKKSSRKKPILTSKCRDLDIDLGDVDKDVTLRLANWRIKLQLRRENLDRRDELGYPAGCVDLFVYGPDGEPRKILVDIGKGLDKHQAIVGWSDKK